MKKTPADGAQRRAFMEETRDVLLDAFYRALNEDAGFTADLAELQRQFREAPADPRAALSPFLAQRPWLPRGASRDIFGAIEETTCEPVLRVFRTIVVTGAPPPGEFAGYDPLVESSSEFLARATRHVRDTEARWKALGRNPIHPKHRSDSVLRREALRLYRRVALAWTFERVADEEEKETHEHCDPETVRTSVRRWSRVLGIKTHGEKTLRGQLGPLEHRGPMPIACQLCSTRNLATDARCVTYSINEDPTPVVAICERCVRAMEAAVLARDGGGGDFVRQARK